MIFAEENNNGLTFYERELSSASKNVIGVLHLDRSIKDVRKDIKRIWVNYQNVQQKEIEIILQFSSDVKLVCYGVNRSGSSNVGEILWEREESLGYIDKVVFMKYEGYADHLNNAYHVKMDKYVLEGKGFLDVASEIPTNIILRIITEIEDVVGWFNKLKEETLKLIMGSSSQEVDISSLSSNKNTIQTLESLVKSPMSEEKEKKYGLRKYMIVFSKKGPFFSIDTKTSRVNWKK